MPKQKTNKSIAKRIKITRNGKVKRGRPGRRHLQSGKTPKTRRQLRSARSVSPKLAKKYIECVIT